MSKVVALFRSGMEYDPCPKCGWDRGHVVSLERAVPVSIFYEDAHGGRVSLSQVLGVTCGRCGHRIGTFAPLDAED
jgi:hypothetical protein